MSAPASNQCNVTSDCQDGFPKQCYEEVQWSDLQNFCDCSSRFGYTGTQCTEVSGQVIYSRISVIVLFLWSSVLFFLYLKEIVLSTRFRLKVTGALLPLNPVYYVA